jgi:membrane-bound lytic murein transglycosylase F
MELDINKTFARIILFLLSLSSLTCNMGCSGNKGDKRNETNQEIISLDIDPVKFDLSEINKRGSLRVILENTSTGYFLYKGRPMGLQYELASRFCEEVGLTMDIVIENDLEKSFRMLLEGEGDIIAHGLTITKARRQIIDFTEPHYEIRQVLVQRKPDGWRDMRLHEIEKTLIRSPSELIGKKIYVKKGSSYVRRLRNLSEEIGGDIVIIEEFGEVLTEELISMVSHGEIDYTVADEDIASISSTFYQNVDVNTPLSLPTQVAWGVRNNSPDLLDAINTWITSMKRKPDFNVLYRRYFEDPKGFRVRIQSDFSSIGGEKISPYDDIIQKYAGEINWDWRLLAALIHQESNFKPDAKSWMGAMGLMQMIPSTAKSYGVTNIFNPEQNIMAGTKHLNWLENYWKKYVSDSLERRKFVMGSYNVGQGHVMDAVRLTEKYNKDPEVWDDNVAYYLLQKSKPKYFKDQVVKSGYCRGEEPVEYVREIFAQYDIYTQFIDK